MSANDPTGQDSRRDDDVVVRKAQHGWVVGKENVSELTSAMVLADLFAAEQAVGNGSEAEAAEDRGAQAPAPRPPAERPNVSSTAMAPSVQNAGNEADEAARLAVTVTQLEHALTSRVIVEQAIGVLAERHRLRPRESFDLLRKAARSRGARVTEMAQDVVASTANPLLRLPEELAREVPEPRQRGRSLRRGGRHAQRA
jgi:ANTAR domain-containing protein